MNDPTTSSGVSKPKPPSEGQGVGNYALASSGWIETRPEETEVRSFLNWNG